MLYIDQVDLKLTDTHLPLRNISFREILTAFCRDLLKAVTISLWPVAGRSPTSEQFKQKASVNWNILTSSPWDRVGLFSKGLFHRWGVSRGSALSQTLDVCSRNKMKEPWLRQRRERRIYQGRGNRICSYGETGGELGEINGEAEGRWG